MTYYRTKSEIIRMNEKGLSEYYHMGVGQWFMGFQFTEDVLMGYQITKEEAKREIIKWELKQL